jgi:hypothetical protein
VAGGWFSPGSLVSSINKTARQDIAEILLKLVLNTITLNPYLKKKIIILIRLNILNTTYSPCSVGNHFFQTLAKMASGLKQVLAKMK